MSDKKEQVLRFSFLRRLEHWLNAGSFISLALTGLIQKYSTAALSIFILKVLGGIETVRIIHRISAIILAVVSIYHIGAFIYGFYVQRKPLSMLPGKEDLIAGWKSLRYNFGLEKHEPKQGFYTFEEKLEYWALIWGTLVMSATGFILWNPILSNKLLPSSFIPVAKAAHSGEALLAVLAILVWHMYHVFIKHFNTSMYTGYISKDIMEHEHALVLEDKDPWQEPDQTDEEFQRRRKVFMAIFPLLGVALLVGLGFFVTIEQTALPKPAPIQELLDLEAYVPAPSTAIPMSHRAAPDDIGTSWNDGFGELFMDNCGICHRTSRKPGGLDLTNYESAMAGGESGLAIRPYSGSISLVVIWPSRGDHPGVFSPGELSAIIDWIDNGAPEN